MMCAPECRSRSNCPSLSSFVGSVAAAQAAHHSRKRRKASRKSFPHARTQIRLSSARVLGIVELGTWKESRSRSRFLSLSLALSLSLSLTLSLSLSLSLSASWTPRDALVACNPSSRFWGGVTIVFFKRFSSRALRRRRRHVLSRRGALIKTTQTARVRLSSRWS